MTDLRAAKRKSRSRPKWNLTLVLIVFSIAAGLIWGAIRPGFFSENDLFELGVSLRHFVSSFSAFSFGTYAAVESILRYGRTFLFIWFCVMLPKAYYAAYLLLFMRASTLSFSAAMMILVFGGRGLLLAFGFYFIQNLIIMPVYSYTIYKIVKVDGPLLSLPKDKQAELAKIAVFGCFCVMLVSMFEVFVLPYLLIFII